MYQQLIWFGPSDVQNTYSHPPARRSNQKDQRLTTLWEYKEMMPLSKNMQSSWKGSIYWPGTIWEHVRAVVLRVAPASLGNLLQSPISNPRTTASEAGWAQQSGLPTGLPLHSDAHWSLKNNALSQISELKSTDHTCAEWWCRPGVNQSFLSDLSLKVLLDNTYRTS